MFLINGKSIEHVSVKDRSFQYGDGCFTTMLALDGAIQDWPLHIERMERCLDLLGIEHPNWHILRETLDKMSATSAKVGLKLHVSRGEGGRGYSPTSVSAPTITLSEFPFPPHYEIMQSNGIELGVCEQRLGHNPLLAGHKHNNRLEQVLLKSEMDRKGYVDGLTLDIDGNVIESTMANVFWVKDNQVYTPSLAKSGVAGVMRTVVLDLLPEIGIDVIIGEFALSHVLEADELFLTNSLLRVAPIVKVNQAPFPIGKITTRIQEYLKQ
ncbi:aminodeoxychorismate lyase [Vibrio sp. S4M6]|nr:aminodeoxychorismate lyase [Vibrio sinus]MCL9783586.1 aminodeoxychorismate lyase [Vibrio sinus]